MKTISKPLFILLLLITSFAFKADSTVIKAKIKNGVLQIGKTTLKGEWQLTDLLGALGKADRERDGYNKTYTYDEKGIVLFNPTNSTLVSEVQFYFSAPGETNEVMPKGFFKGEMTVDKLKITAELTPATMKKGLKKWADSDSYMEHSYRKEFKGVYIYFQFNDAETALVKMSTGVAKN